MRTVFADTAYYLALLLKNDDLQDKALAFDDTDPDLRIVTCDVIFVEMLAHMASRGTHLRQGAPGLIDLLRAAPNVTILRQTPELFDAALELYRRRPDKAYSLADCMSMVICEQEAITEVLTHDHHFEQEGLTILL